MAITWYLRGARPLILTWGEFEESNITSDCYYGLYIVYVYDGEALHSCPTLKQIKSPTYFSQLFSFGFAVFFWSAIVFSSQHLPAKPRLKRYFHFLSLVAVEISNWWLKSFRWFYFLLFVIEHFHRNSGNHWGAKVACARIPKPGDCFLCIC